MAGAAGRPGFAVNLVRPPPGRKVRTGAWDLFAWAGGLIALGGLEVVDAPVLGLAGIHQIEEEGHEGLGLGQ